MSSMWQRLSKREKTLVAASLAALLVVLGRYLLVVPYLDHREAVKNQLEIQPQRLEKNLRYVSQKAEIEAGVERARAEIKGLDSVLLSGDTPSVSASSLQEVVQSLAAKEGTQVITTRVLNPETTGQFTKIPIQLEISAQIDQLANLVKGIESADKLLVINELTVRSLFTPAAVRPPGAGPSTPSPPQTLRASLVVAGFARSSTGPGQKVDAPSTKAQVKDR